MTYPKKKIYNPLNKDFSQTYDINEDGKPPTFTINAKDIAEFDAPVAEHLAKHLATEYVNVHGTKPNHEVAYKRALDIINLDNDEIS